jgi:toxin secretion/phage lysis holin
MYKTILIKCLSAIPLSYFFFTDEWQRVVMCLIFIIIIDTALGMMLAIKYKKFTSAALGRKAAMKFIRYGMALLTVYLLSIADYQLFGWSFHYLTMFFILTEVVSNFEKLSLLGLKIPTKMMSLINSKYKELLGKKGEDRKEQVEEIVDNSSKQ